MRSKEDATDGITLSDFTGSGTCMYTCMKFTLSRNKFEKKNTTYQLSSHNETSDCPFVPHHCSSKNALVCVDVKENEILRYLHFYMQFFSTCVSLFCFLWTKKH